MPPGQLLMLPGQLLMPLGQRFMPSGRLLVLLGQRFMPPGSTLSINNIYIYMNLIKLSNGKP
jgi:hypothetical protein